jgi:hypothetical protein
MEVVNQRGEVVNNDQQTCLVARRPQSGASQKPQSYFFATVESLDERWQCPRKSFDERKQAQMESQYFEDFRVGDAFDTRARTVTETDVASLVSAATGHCICRRT